MPNLFSGNKICTEPMSGNYVDKSFYINDASIIMGAIDFRKVEHGVAQQIEIVCKVANDSIATPDDLHDAVQKLCEIVDVYRKIDRIKHDK